MYPPIHPPTKPSTHQGITTPPAPALHAQPPSQLPVLPGFAPDPIHRWSCSRGTAGWGCRVGRPASGYACGEVGGERGSLGLGGSSLTSPWPPRTSWRRQSSGCRRCHPRHSRDPGPGSSQHRLPHTRHSGAGPGGSRLRPRTHTAVAVGDKEDRVRYYLIPTALGSLQISCSGAVVMWAMPQLGLGWDLATQAPAMCYDSPSWRRWSSS